MAAKVVFFLGWGKPAQMLKNEIRYDA
jgi:hypothetical protein